MKATAARPWTSRWAIRCNADMVIWIPTARHSCLSGAEMFGYMQLVKVECAYGSLQSLRKCPLSAGWSVVVLQTCEPRLISGQLCKAQLSP